ncbi:MAG: hypothetical protein CVV52_12910 [Spirochaetae bacterium HGW-Spirochaetae-8]|jgi:protein-S-isoprenylcysteine O-methyltransferase Ste14|nr:MAG: hypothetical protein CVV52_12910 [Spirochaetae bacterium HGW-Spirochaetae-8]
MGLIKLFILGATGYFLTGLYDVAILRKRPLLKKILSVGFPITATPYLFLFLAWESPHSTFMQWTIVVLLLCFSILLVYSVLLEIPLSSVEPAALYQGGTYRFSRHPGFIWFTIINLLIPLYFWNFGISLICLGFILCDLALIFIEDRYFFPEMFPEYGEYKKKTPFFLSLRYNTTRST